MLDGLNTAAAGMAAQQQRIGAVANDLANVSTTGYKRVRVGFRDLVYQEVGRAGAGGVRAGTGAAAVDAGRSFGQGSMQRTDNPLDVAVSGEGFLRVRLPDGRQALTRDGSLRIDGDGRLVTATGALVQPPVTVPAGTPSGDVRIGRDGTVTAGEAVLGRLELVSVRAPQGLVPAGSNAFLATPASGAPRAAAATTTLEAGALEASNVDVGSVMVELIDAQRSFQLASKAISTADEMMQIANGIKR